MSFSVKIVLEMTNMEKWWVFGAGWMMLDETCMFTFVCSFLLESTNPGSRVSSGYLPFYNVTVNIICHLNSLDLKIMKWHLLAVKNTSLLPFQMLVANGCNIFLMPLSNVSLGHIFHQKKLRQKHLWKSKIAFLYFFYKCLDESILIIITL